MAFEISRREVLNNLIRFKDNLQEMRDERQQRPFQKTKERTYKVLLNRRTGDMRFAQKISSMEHHIFKKRTSHEAPGDWKEVYIIVGQKSPREKIYFNVCDNLRNPLKSTDIERTAWRVASETINILNFKAKEVKESPAELLPEEAVLGDLSSIHLADTKQQIQDLPGWMGSLNRIDAETILVGKPVGTYLLREGDEMTASIAFHLERENLLFVQPFLLTVVEKEEKISDILLLQTNKGWIVYSDNPDLLDVAYKYHPSPQGLILSITHSARRPLQ